MNRQEVYDVLNRVDALAAEISLNVPADNPASTAFRSDVAGMLLVFTCATYETCVKESIYAFARRFSTVFGAYAECQYEKINSRIDIDDLKKFAKTFHPQLGVKFKNLYDLKRSAILDRSNEDIQEFYKQMLRWRHSVAHTGARVTTIEEVLRHHMYAKRVIFTFAEALHSFSPA